MTKHDTLNTLKTVNQVRSLSEWKDRTYLNLEGQDKGFAGDRNTKLYVNRDGELVIEEGKGTMSRPFWGSIKAVKVALGIN